MTQSKRQNGSSPACRIRPRFSYGGSKAFYSSITDRITLPPRELFITLAVATIGRDRESLESELAMERAVQAG